MRRTNGRVARDDDEWYTPRETADKVAAWLAGNLDLETPILCPADLLPDGSESAIPAALRAAGFKRVRVTRDLPVVTQAVQDWLPGEVIVTNPPFSLLSQFRRWVEVSGARFCVLSRQGGMCECWSIPELGSSFYATDGRSVSAAWLQNIADTSRAPSVGEVRVLDDCGECHRKACPRNSMTEGWAPGNPRKLYGWGAAVKLGFAGWHCREHTDATGSIAFTRFFDPNE